MSYYEERIAGGTLEDPPQLGTTAHNGPNPPIECQSLEDLKSHLRHLLNINSLAFVPSLVTALLHLNANVRFKVTSALNTLATREPNGTEVRDGQDTGTHAGIENPQKIDRTEDLSMAEALQDTADSKSRIKLQRLVAWQIVNAIKDVDGFGYGVQGEHDSRIDGHRYTFLCHDSHRNKERRRPSRGVARTNEGSGSVGTRGPYKSRFARVPWRIVVD